MNPEQRFQKDCETEMHRDTYGRPWSLGNHFFDFLLENHLEKHHKVLDFGCGAGRLGIHLIQHLDKGCYFGIESHGNSLRAFSEYEIPKLNLASKCPRLLFDKNFNFDHFETKFDFIIETSVTQHIYDDSMLLRAYQNISNVLSPKGKYLVSPRLRFSEKEMNNLGLKYERDYTSHFMEFEQTKYEAKTYWSSYTKHQF